MRFANAVTPEGLGSAHSDRTAQFFQLFLDAKALITQSIASAGRAAIDLDDENYGKGLKICYRPQELDTSEGLVSWSRLGRSGREGVDVNVIDGEVWMGRGEDDEADVGVGSLGKNPDQDQEVECELGIPQVYPASPVLQ